jgi:glycosyltransferase involved in cell wall biosynthesis
MGKNQELKKRNIVISGINLFQAGALSIYYNLLDCMIGENYTEQNVVTIFVHKKELFAKYEGKVEIIELPKSRKNYLCRIFYEYLYFYFYSINKNIDIWISLHDMTPNVRAKKRYVYCHNAFPFMSEEVSDYVGLDFKENLLRKLYNYAYRINIKKNNAVIVQQQWFAKEIYSRFGVEKVIVSRPSVEQDKTIAMNKPKTDDIYRFIYPAYPRNFKNYEVVCNAAKILQDKNIKCEILLTIDGGENEYSNGLYEKYQSVSNILWLGLLDRDALYEKYAESDCLLFPSLLESWGLPITEYKQFNKEILCANLPYGHETVGMYEKVRYFNPLKAEELANMMIDLIKGNIVHDCVSNIEIDDGICNSWAELLDVICK